MPARVTSFPFNIMSDPMYVGSTTIFFATAILRHSPAGFVLTAVTGLVYYIALRFEGPFTDYIYSEAAKKKAAKKQ